MRHLLPSLALLLGLSACDASVSPLVDADRNFSLYGVLNPRADSQGVVVFPIEPTLRDLPAEPLGVSVSSSDLTSGETVAWRDSVVTDEAGTVHVFWAPFTARHDHEYRIDVSDDDGRSSEVTVRVPPLAEFEPGMLTDIGFLTQPVRVTAPVERLNNLTVVYTIRALLPPSLQGFVVELAGGPLTSPGGSGGPTTGVNNSTDLVEKTAIIPIQYESGAERQEDGWSFTINFNSDFGEILRRINRRGGYDTGYGLQLLEIRVEAIAANEAWNPPGGTFDQDILLQPGTMSNVDRGFGFVGAGYRMERLLAYDDETISRMGFRPPTD